MRRPVGGSRRTLDPDTHIDDLRESPALTVIDLLRSAGAEVSDYDLYIPVIGRGRKYNLQMTCSSLQHFAAYDCVLILTDHSDYDYGRIVSESQLVVDTRNATRQVRAQNVIYC